MAGLKQTRSYRRSVSVMNVLKPEPPQRDQSESTLLRTVVANLESCQPGDCFEIDLSYEHIGSAGLNRIIASAMGMTKPAPKPAPKPSSSRRRQRKPEPTLTFNASVSRSYLTLLNLTGNSIEADLRTLVDFLNPPSSPTHGQLPTSPKSNKILRRHTYVDNGRKRKDAVRTLTPAREPTISSAKLHTLILACNNIGSKGASMISNALSVENSITHLDLSDNNIGPEGVRALQLSLNEHRSQIWQRFSILNSSQNGVEVQRLSVNEVPSRLSAPQTGRGGITPPLPPLQVLGLWGNKLGIEGATHVAHILKSCNLKRLDLGGNQIADDGANALAEALRASPTLTFLDLNNNRITDKSASTLLSCKQDIRKLDKCRINVIGNAIIDQEIISALFAVSNAQNPKASSLKTTSDTSLNAGAPIMLT